MLRTCLGRGCNLLLLLGLGSLVQGFVPPGPASALVLPANAQHCPGDRVVGAASRPATRLQAATLSELRDINRKVGDMAVEGISIMELQRNDLREAAALCVEAFFGESNGVNPVRNMQLATLVDEQLSDLKSRWRAGPKAVMLKAVDDETGAIVGFVEVSASPGNKYGFGGEKEVRPYLANLAVRRSARRRGIGRVLGMACEELARGWGFEDILLQVEEDNVAARELYRGLGYDEFFSNRGGRRYDLSTFTIRSVPVTKIYLRKAWKRAGPMEQMWCYLQNSFNGLQQ